MKKNYYIYNNEAISCCVLMSVLKLNEKIDYARFFLILPYLLDNRTVSILNSKKTILFEDLLKEGNAFYNFNNRFISLLPVTINCLVMLSDINFIRLDNQRNIYISLDLKDFPVFENSKRLVEIEKAIPVFLELTKNYSTEYLYKISGVQL
ncbi:TPA: three component ABC system middle component [Acinetobacter baumannii]|nr:three component ABC system middle component [Acinetobacter baumannii]